MPEPDDMVLPLLREMREDIRKRFDAVDRRFTTLKSDLDARFDDVDERMRALEKLARAQREAFQGESILGRYAVKEVEERLAEIERRLAAVEARS